MKLLRSSLVLILLTAMLPWSAFAVPAPQAAFHGSSVVEDDTKSHAGVTVGRKCPGKSLPGSLCGPDITGVFDTPLPTLPRMRSDLLSHGDWLVAGHDHIPATGPPRLS